MDTLKIIEPASVEEAFDLRPVNTTSDKTHILNLAQGSNSMIQELPGSNKHEIEPGGYNNEFSEKPFIIANTQATSLGELRNDCIVPVFSKDNSRTISHQEFIEITQNCVAKAFPNYDFTAPEVRVSHEIKGRIPEAVYKNVKDLLPHEITHYWERMAFIIKVPAISDTVNSNLLSLTIGGIRSYNLENLYNKKTLERFKLFIGFQNQICMNLCVSSDGFVDDMRVGSYHELEEQIMDTIQNYQAEKHLKMMKDFTNYSLTEQQFAQLIGKARLYNHLPKKLKSEIPELMFTDGHFNSIAKDYYQDESFCKDDDGNINLWNVYNLFTQANKSSYIDTFFERNLNAFDFNQGISKAISGNSDYHWFLS